MSGENILVVDDAVVTLKLIATVLRNSGYKVQLHSTAEQALSSMNTMRPDLLLVDIQLPGMDGLELTRRVRQQTRLQNIVVIAMTASVREGIEQEARDAGCNGFIAKPVEPKALAAQIRGFLEGEPEEPGGQDEMRSVLGKFSLSGPETETLRRDFLDEALRQSQRLLTTFDTQFDSVAAKQLLYRWIGTAGLLGYEAISREALAMEPLLAATPRDMARLREALSNLILALQDASQAANTPLPDAIMRELTRLRVALVGFADAEADRLCGALERVGSRPRLYRIEHPPDSDSVKDCDVVMVHVRPETMETPWLAAGTAGLQKPLVLVGAREHLLALDTAVQSRAREFLIDGWQPEEALMRLRFALPSFVPAGDPPPGSPPGPGASPEVISPEVKPLAQAEPVSPACVEAAPLDGSGPEVLIADDDEDIRKLVQTMLKSHGMNCLMASTGTEALRMVRQHCPRAVVLDVNIPGMDGFQLLAEIRREKLPARVIMLTGRQQERDIIRGFELGADDYVVKPFNPRELVLRISRLL
ncbi:MAG: response regulator [Bryobacteraceae bacterium]|jgi:two-component system cell cycle response regulator DivK